jgi:hypothetical protein
MMPYFELKGTELTIWKGDLVLTNFDFWFCTTLVNEKKSWRRNQGCPHILQEVGFPLQSM